MERKWPRVASVSDRLMRFFGMYDPADAGRSDWVGQYLPEAKK